MRHERWDSALFLHWKFQKTFIQNLLPPGLYVDAIPNVSQDQEPTREDAWLGMVLLSELGVGATCCRAVLVDHHGANLRVYVMGPDGPGIYFLSLECSSILASVGARAMAIPYWPSSMTRAESVQKQESGSTDDSMKLEQTNLFQMTSSRRNIYCCASNAAAPHVDCIWTTAPPAAASHTEENKDNTQWVQRASFFLERYRVYTFRGGQLYSGTVSHEPWPIVPAHVQRLNQSLSAAIEGLPTALRDPTHCCYSKGVGPVDFAMLRPCLN